VATKPDSPTDSDTQTGRDVDPGGPPSEVSKPVGDAIPTPVEPGLDQPLPEKGATPSVDATGSNAATDPLGDTDTPPGVPPPSGSDFA
jgi:hypothetical protein